MRGQNLAHGLGLGHLGATRLAAAAALWAYVIGTSAAGAGAPFSLEAAAAGTTASGFGWASAAGTASPPPDFFGAVFSLGSGRTASATLTGSGASAASSLCSQQKRSFST